MIPLSNASDLNLGQNNGTLPDMSGTISGWFQNLTMTVVTKSVVNFETVEVLTPTDFMGVRQPLSPQRLAMKPEGQRKWRWEQIHCWPSLALTPDDIIVFQGTRYRVMAKKDYKEYGYLEYEIMEDFVP